MAAETGAGGLNLDDLGSFTRTVQAGEFVFRAGDAGAEIFIIQDGSVDLLAGTDLTRVGAVDAGGIFGEAGLFAPGPRTVSARAATDVRLIHLDRAAFDRVVVEAPQVAVAMLQQLATRASAQYGALQDALARVVTSASAPAPAPAAAPAEAPAPASPRTRGEPKLVAVESGAEFPLSGPEEAIVGRRDANSGVTPAVDLTALDGKRTLSRQHAKLAHRDTGVFVYGATGRNGTFVNGVRVEAGAEVELHDGDQVQFGFVKTVFQWR